MPRKKTTITITEHNNRMKNQSEQIARLQDQCLQRDKLIGLMQSANRRDNRIHSDLKQRVETMVTLMDTFMQNWNNFKSISLYGNEERAEFDENSHKKAVEIRAGLEAIYPNRGPAQMSGTDGVAKIGTTRRPN